MLPAGYLFSRDEDDEGNEIVNITAGEYENDEGETCYKFTCRVSYTEYDPEEADEEFTSDNLLDLLAERMEDSRRMKLPGTPKVTEEQFPYTLRESLKIEYALITQWIVCVPPKDEI